MPLIVGGVAALAAIVVGLALLAGGRGLFGATAPTATPTIDPRLVLHTRTMPISGALSDGIHLSGTLYPAIPGRNTLRLTLQPETGSLPQQSQLTLSVSMPGMLMPPIHATLLAHDHSYSGALTLPMFGTYRATVVADTSNGSSTGIITLTLPLAGL